MRVDVKALYDYTAQSRKSTIPSTCVSDPRACADKLLESGNGMWLTVWLAVEFDFQQGDIIAVTSTPEDGWWSGELLDEARRLPGRTDFPSNL
jgi:hypothetical protein